MFGQLSNYERIIRYGLGIVVMALSVIVLQIPMQFAFAASYLIFTAMMQWDPIYALFLTIRRQLTKGAAPAGPAYASR